MKDSTKSTINLIYILIFLFLFGGILFYLQMGRVEYSPGSILLLILPVLLALLSFLKYLASKKNANKQELKRYTMSLLVLSLILFASSIYLLINTFETTLFSVTCVYLISTVTILYARLELNKSN